MGRLDTALNWKNWVRYWHRKITYEVPCADCPNPHDCPTWWEWDPIKEECVKPTCEPEDSGYECNCQCEADEVCEDWLCVREEPKVCWECHSLDPVTWECVFDPTLPWCWDEKKCPEWWEEDYDWDCYCKNCRECESPCYWDYYEWCICPGSDKKECGKCYSKDPDTWECVPDPTKCPEKSCPEWWEEDPETWECKDPSKGEPFPGDPVNPDVDDCFDFTKVWDWATVNTDWKTTWLPWDTKRNWIRYWYSTLCYDKVEFFARITTVWEWANKSWIEHWYAETKWNMSYVASAYFWDFVQLHHDDVLKIIIYSDWREETYIKSFIRPWIWSWWEVFSNIKRPETPPSWKISWLVVWVLWWAEIWGMKWYKYQETIDEEDAVIESTPEHLASNISYIWQEAWWTVADWNWRIWPTMWFWWENPCRWTNWETKRYYCTYKDWVLTVPRNVSWRPTKFSYIWGVLPYESYYSTTERRSWYFDMKFKLVWWDKTWGFTIYWWKNTGYGEIYMPLHANVSIYEDSELYNKELRLVTEAYYCWSWCVSCYSKLYYWTWNWIYNWWDRYRVWEDIFQLDYWVSWAEAWIEIVLDSHSSATGIEINYASEWYAY